MRIWGDMQNAKIRMLIEVRTSSIEPQSPSPPTFWLPIAFGVIPSNETQDTEIPNARKVRSGRLSADFLIRVPTPCRVARRLFCQVKS